MPIFSSSFIFEYYIKYKTRTFKNFKDKFLLYYLKVDEKKIKERRKYGEHLTPIGTFEQFILPEIQDRVSKFTWTDLYCGEGNLIFPLIESLPFSDRAKFFTDNVFLFDIQEKMVKTCIKKAIEMGVSEQEAKKKILLRDTLKTFPKELKSLDKPLYHVTNPPYLYLGHIRKNNEMRTHLSYFEDKNAGYQDLYQIAMVNDLRNKVQKMIYIIPSNFLFGKSVSNKIRDDFLKYYTIEKAYIFENQIFEFTGTNACLCFFKRKERVGARTFSFYATKIQKDGLERRKFYLLKPRFHYKAGSAFDEFLIKYQTKKPLGVSFYFTKNDITKGNLKLAVIDANKYQNGAYEKRVLQLDAKTRERVQKNVLYIRTVDTGSNEGRLGLEVIKNDFQVEGIYVSEKEYRTHPIQLFFTPQLTFEEQLLLRDYFNYLVEAFRKELDSDFLTTYRYSNGGYTRKYMGLTQVKALIETCPLVSLREKKEVFKKFILKGDLTTLRNFLERYSQQKIQITDFV